MLKDELLNLRCRPPPAIISELRALLVFVSVIQQTIKPRNGRGGGRRRFHYDSGQNPLKANFTGKKSKSTNYSSGTV
ncbi:hypothetical protein ALC56_08384 [Trachymyrmex septentrionalis]|uniref:Uncharacterized protein n=1 Tax=Trachymyrmex septentrionalis TaxID=34720 RepID=A0A195FAC1_9HYME|nr:hypothetical protein ALC56_08384 [Trachymyrmex septentrionalis]